MKKICISEKLFMDIFKYFNLDSPSQELYEDIRTQLDEKILNIQKREAYTKYKTGRTKEEQEKARQKYLDLIGVHEDFRY